jgi:hypothetical protein
VVDGKLAGGAGFAIEVPRRHPCVARRLKGRDELLKRVERQLVTSRNSMGRDCSSVHRQPAMGRASCHGRVISEAHHTRKKVG